MGTKGAFGIKLGKGKRFLVYSPEDSYPSGLGNTLIGEIKVFLAKNNGSLDELVAFFNKKLESLKILSYDENQRKAPTKAMAQRLIKQGLCLDKHILSRDNGKFYVTDWYSLTRNTKSFKALFDSGVMSRILRKQHSYGELQYFYIVNLETRKFEYRNSDYDLVSERALDNLKEFTDDEDEETEYSSDEDGL